MAAAAKGPSNFSWVIEGLLAGCAYPSHAGHFRFLLKEGIKHLVTLTDYAPPPYVIPKELQHYHIPIEEFDAPTIEQMMEFTRLVNLAQQRKEGLAVHCYWGRGRTGTMLAAYLVGMRGIGADDAIEQIRIMRPYSIETYEQEEAVRLYAAFYDKVNKGSDNDKS